MAQVTSKAPITHLPTAPSPPVSTITVPTSTGNAPRTITSVASGNRALTLGGSSVQIDPTKHTPQNVVDIINGASLPGITATLDRYGNLVINGVSTVSGDAGLLQQLGLS